MSKENKYRVTVKGWMKLVTTGALLLLAFFFSSSTALLMALFAYTLWFIFLSLAGSNSKVATWLAGKKFFIYICFLPTVLSLMFCLGVINDPHESFFAVCGILLGVLTIPLVLILMAVQGGIRRWGAFIVFVFFPVAIFIVLMLLAKNYLVIGVGAVFIAALATFFVGISQHMHDHKADISSRSDSAESGHYTAKWDGLPRSSVNDNVIHIEGDIIVSYFGYLDERKAGDAVNALLQKYAGHVASDMPGYSVDGAKVNVTYKKLD